MRVAGVLQSSGLIELNDTEHLGVTDHGKADPDNIQIAKSNRQLGGKGGRNRPCGGGAWPASDHN